MNSSLLITAFVAASVTAVVGVFFSDGLFSDGAGTRRSEYAITDPIAAIAAVKSQSISASAGIVNDFSWDDESNCSNQDDTDFGLLDAKEATVRTDYSEDALAEVFSDAFDDTQRSVVKKSADRVVDDAVSQVDDWSDSASSITTHDLTQSTSFVSKQVDSDLGKVFDELKITRGFDDEARGSSLRTPAKSGSDTRARSSETAQKSQEAPADVFADQFVLAAAKKADMKLDAFDFGAVQPDVKVNESDDESRQSVVAAIADRSKAKMTEPQSGTEHFISGSLEPVTNSTSTQTQAKPLARQFKITNPQETNLPVTLSVDGRQITLQPGQTYVIKETDGAVDVIFSRGGSFGFHNQVLTTGHYRFSVSRAAGWKLNN